MKTILFPTDFSTDANNALKYAIRLSEQTKSALIVFHSTFIPETLPKKEYQKTLKEALEYKQKMLEYMVIALCKKNKLHLPEKIIYDCKNGNSIVKNILATAKAHGAEMIIVGTHGTTALRKVLFGSTTSGLILKSTIPILTIPQRFSYKKINTIVYASDMAELSNEVSHLQPIAKAIGAPIEVLYLDYWNKWKEKEAQFNKTIEKKHLKNTFFVSKSVSIEKTMAEHLINYTRKNKHSILAMFPEDRNFFEKIFFQSITEKVVFKLNKPLLSIRK